MLKSTPILILLSLSFAFWACEDKNNNPKYVTEAFLKAFTEQRFKDAKAISSSETHAMLDIMTQMLAMIGEKDKPKPEKWEPLAALNCKIVKDTTAICSCTTQKEAKTSEVNLVKRQGKWLVKMGKDDIQPKP